MAVAFHDEIELEDFEYDEETETYYYPCPCGDRFEILKDDLYNGEEVATCPSCSLIIKVLIFLLFELKKQPVFEMILPFRQI